MLQLAQNFLVFGKSIDLMLREDQATINFHVKNAALALDQFGIDAIGVFNGGRQTGGLGRVVSHYAIGNLNVHNQPLLSAASMNKRTWLSQFQSAGATENQGEIRFAGVPRNR